MGRVHTPYTKSLFLWCTIVYIAYVHVAKALTGPWILSLHLIFRQPVDRTVRNRHLG